MKNLIILFEEVERTNYNNWTITLGVVSLIFIILFFRQFRINSKARKKIEQLKSAKATLEIENKELRANSQTIKREKDRLKNVNNKLVNEKFEYEKKEQNKLAKEEVIFEEDQPSPTVPLSSSPSSLSNKEQISGQIEESKPDSSYLSFPDNDSVFYAPEATKSPNEDSFYEISENVLTLYSNISPKQMQIALNFPENHIKRACLIKNSKEPHHTKIQMITPGKVARVEDDFKIIEKMTVKYD